MSLTLALWPLWQRSQVWIRAGFWLPLQRALAGQEGCTDMESSTLRAGLMLPSLRWLAGSPLGRGGRSLCSLLSHSYTGLCWAARLGPWLLPGRRREKPERGGVWTGRREQDKPAPWGRGWGWCAAVVSCTTWQDLLLSGGRSSCLWLKRLWG